MLLTEPGGLVRPLRGPARGRSVVAIDLGTARTQVSVPGAGVVIDEPSLVAVDHRGIVAAGREAWVLAESGSARLQMPVRHGEVVDPVAATQMLRLLIASSGLSLASDVEARIAIPAGLGATATSLLTGVVAAATGLRVRPVGSAVAVQHGAPPDRRDESALLVCDIGAGLTEVAAITKEGETISRSNGFGLRAYDQHRSRALRAASDLAHEVRDLLGARNGSTALASRMLLVGGGGLRPDLNSDIATTCALSVWTTANPRETLVRGLIRVPAHAALAA